MGNTVQLQYNLHTINDPIVRIGVQGLYRALRFAKALPSGLSWAEEQDHILTVNAESWQVLREFARQSFSPNQYGILVPPGYESDPDDSNFGATIISSKGLIDLYPPATNGTGMSRHQREPAEKCCGLSAPHPSLSINVGKTNTLVWTFSIGESENPETDIIKVARILELNPERIVPFGETTLKKGVTCPTMLTIKSAWHPMFSTWGLCGMEVDSTSDEGYALYFNPFGYVYIQSLSADKEKHWRAPLALGLDVATFSEATRIQKRRAGMGTLSLYAQQESALLSLLSKLGMSLTRYWPVLSGDGPFDFKAIHTQNHTFYQVLADSMAEKPKSFGAKGYSDQVSALEKAVLIDVNKTTTSVYDVVYRNLAANREWFADLSDLVCFGVPKNKKKIGLVLEDLMAMNTTEENALFDMGAKMTQSIYFANQNNRRDWDWARAQVKNALRSARSADRISAVITELLFVDPDNQFGLTKEEFELLNLALRQNAQKVRSCLLMGSNYRKSKVAA